MDLIGKEEKKVTEKLSKTYVYFMSKKLISFIDAKSDAYQFV